MKMQFTVESTKAQRDEMAERLANAKPNSIATERPDLLEFWDWEKNEEIGLDPYTATCALKRVAFWKCPNYPDHGFDMNIDTRVKAKITCPYCSGKRVLTGFNDLATTHPAIASEWVRPVDKDDITPQTVSAGSHAVVRWLCSKHKIKWNAAIYDRTNGKGCELCKREKISKARSRVKPGNSLAEKYPEVAAEWDYELNEKTPQQVSAHAREKANFICYKHDEPYRWAAEIHTRTGKLKAGCPRCANEACIAALKKPVKGKSLGDVYPDSLLEWAYDLNDGITPYDVKPHSQQEFNWRCSICGRTWKTTVGNRTQKEFALGCSKCKNSRLNHNRLHPRTKGYLIDTRPEIAAEWDHDKNKELLGISLENISSSSCLDVWWICPEGHSYHTSVNHRTGRGDGCNICATRSHISFPEKAIYYYVSQLFEDAKANARHDDHGLGNLELDIWIPSIQTAVEYDGWFWHSDSERDARKDNTCRQSGIKLIRIREHGCPSYDTSAILIERETVYDSWSLDKAIKSLLAILGKEDCVDVSTERDFAVIKKIMDASCGISSPEEVLTDNQLHLDVAC